MILTEPFIGKNSPLFLKRCSEVVFNIILLVCFNKARDRRYLRVQVLGNTVKYRSFRRIEVFCAWLHSTDIFPVYAHSIYSVVTVQLGQTEKHQVLSTCHLRITQQLRVNEFEQKLRVYE